VPGIGEVVQRLCPVGPALSAGGGWGGREDGAQRRDVGGRRRGVDVFLGDAGALGEEPAGLGPALRLVIGVPQAGEAQECVRQVAGRGFRYGPGGNRV
jgi:hypothetical protein